MTCYRYSFISESIRQLIWEILVKILIALQCFVDSKLMTLLNVTWCQMSPKLTYPHPNSRNVMSPSIVCVPLTVNSLVTGVRCCGAYFLRPSSPILWVARFLRVYPWAAPTMTSVNRNLRDGQGFLITTWEKHTRRESVLYLKFAVAYVTHYVFLLVRLMTFMSRYSSKELVKLLGPRMCEAIN